MSLAVAEPSAMNGFRPDRRILGLESREQMEERIAEDQELLTCLEHLLSSPTEAVTIKVTGSLQRALQRLKGVVRGELEDADAQSKLALDSLVPPPEAIDPRDRKYYAMYRSSFSYEHPQPPEQGWRENLSGAIAPGPSWKQMFRKAVIAGRFLHRSQSRFNVTLDEEMDMITSWNDFNINRVAQLSDRQPLLMVGMMAFTHFGLLTAFDIEQEVAVDFLKAVEHHYMPNPYHNSTHAADVTQALICILHQDSLAAPDKLNQLEVLAIILAAIAHDVAHPGFNNAFLNNTHDEQALMYNNQSSNEALSLAIMFKILQASECNLFARMNKDDYFYVRRLITHIILGTDMAFHSDMLEQARPALQRSASIWEAPNCEAKLLFMKALVHVADISNAVRPAWKAGMWTRAVYEEFFKQGEAEKSMDLAVSPLCDRDSVNIPESQIAFLKFVVRPTWELLKNVVPTSYKTAMDNLNVNLQLWEALFQNGSPGDVLETGMPPADAPATVHVAPNPSPFHGANRNAWGNASMLLLLLNDEQNSVIARGIALLNERSYKPYFGSTPLDDGVPFYAASRSP